MLTSNKEEMVRDHTQTVTADYIRDIARKIESIYPSGRSGLLDTSRFFGGYRVFETPPPIPKFKLSSQVQVSEEFRKKMDAWLLERFGTREPLLKDSEVIVSEQYGMMIMNPIVTGKLFNCAV